MGETLSIRLNEKLANALRKEAQQTGLGRGQIVRQALESRLRHGGKLAVMQHYFGPSDLSTNKAYRRNWKKRRCNWRASFGRDCQLS